MLSVLIPVYNYDIRYLLRQLAHQCSQLHVPYEIICLDDASSAEFLPYYQEIKKELKIQWSSVVKNIGRAAARNSLVRQASYENLLFLDCDVSLPTDHFIENYIQYIRQSKFEVVYGACIYTSDKPKDRKMILHWLYGSINENPKLETRLKNPYSTFHTVNFLTKRSILLKYPFDEIIRQYGHEDSLWAEVLKKNHIKIQHIDNPVQHDGIYPNTVFLRKTAQSIRTLIFLENKKMAIQTRLYSMFKKLQVFGLDYVYFKIYQKFEKRIVQNLLSTRPSMFYYSLYKMGLLLRFKRK